MPTVLGYVRVSSIKQVELGSGLETQKDRIRAWCTYQGLPEPDIDSDEARSGKDDTRPGFKRIISRALNEPGCILIVYSIDRLGRDSVGVQETLAALLDSGVRVVSLVEGIDSASGMGRALLKVLITVLASFAELERETILGRMADGRAHAKATNRAYARHAPYGLSKDADGNLVENQRELDALSLMKRLRAEGRSYREIGRFLEELGVPARCGNPWTATTISRIVGGGRRKSQSLNPATARIERIRRENQPI